MSMESKIAGMAKAARDASTAMAKCLAVKKNEVLLKIPKTGKISSGLKR